MQLEQTIQPEDQTPICYYSTFPLFDENINTQLIKKQKFVQKLQLYLGEEWKIYAGCSIYYNIDEEKRYLNWQYFFDYLLILWFEVDQRLEDELPAFLDEVKTKLDSNFLKQDELYSRPVCEGFYISASIVWQKVQSSRCSSSENIVQMVQETEAPKSNSYKLFQPLAIVTGKIISYIKQKPLQFEQPMKQMFGSFPQFSNFGFNQFLQQKQQWAQQEQNSRQRFMSSIGDKILSQESIQKAYQQMQDIFNKKYEQFQVAQQFVMTIIEVKSGVQKNIMDKTGIVNLRFLQPASGFYNDLLQIWILIRDHETTFDYQEFIKKVILFLGNKWNDKYLYPTQFFYQILFESWQQICNDINLIKQPEDQKIKILVGHLREQLQQVWENEIVMKIFNHQNQSQVYEVI